MANEKGAEKKEVDLFRETPVRLLGYTNEVGESFRALIHVNLVRLSYVLAFGYCVADTVDKTVKCLSKTYSNHQEKTKAAASTAADVIIWQTLASVVLPGFTINRICYITLLGVKKYTSVTPLTRKWCSVATGLCSIPFIIKPIDNSVDFLLDNSLRRFLK